MNDPLARGSAQSLPEVGEGCIRRFDPHALSEDHGADFAQARALWQALQDAGKLTRDAPKEGEPAAVVKPD